jgi:signal transduction histidine kinase
MNAPTVSALLHGGAALVCVIWTLLVLATGRGWVPRILALAPAAAALWAAGVALLPGHPLTGLAGGLEMLRGAVWLAALLVLYRRVGGPDAVQPVRRFALAGGGVALLALLTLVPGVADWMALPSLGSPMLLARLGLALVIVLLAENLYRNADDPARWYVNLPCIALGGLAVFDLLLYADAALSREFSVAMLDARAALTALAMPLLAVAAVRDRRWRRDPQVSRAVVFHGATLVLGGAFLLGVGAAGEALRALGAGDAEGSWGRAAQVSLLASAIMAVAVGAASQSVRSRLHRLVVDHFFTARYDYRREWLRCVATLSAPDAEAMAPVRAIRALADAADSPAGVLLLRASLQPGANQGATSQPGVGQPGVGQPVVGQPVVGQPGAGEHFTWSESWNLPKRSVMLAPTHALIAGLRGGSWVADLDGTTPPDLEAAYGPLWLGVPLLHDREGLVGAVLLAAPRAAFALDRETYDLLRTLGREVAMFLAERSATERLAEQRRLQEYAKRFAFVAHDVKTVSSQLTLLLANAEQNMQDPEFQRDMLLTVRASSARINTLIARLRQPDPTEHPDAPKGVSPPGKRATGPAPATPVPSSVAALEHLRRFAAARPSQVKLLLHGDDPGLASMAPERFDAAVMHLLNNAAEASGPNDPIRVVLRREGDRMLIDITDQGPGMTAEFMRDELFRPLSTSKEGGSGIGAWQARELLREAGGELEATSRPGQGTTMRLSLRLAAKASPVVA